MSATAETAEATSGAAEHAAAERWVEAFTEGWRAPTGADAFADHFEPWFTDDVRMIQPQMPASVGKAAFRELFRPIFELIPDLHATVHRWAANGDAVMIEFTLEGTVGGRLVHVRSVDRMTLRDGLVSERVAFFDPAPLLRAVAASPRSWPKFLQIQASQLFGRLRSRGGSR